MSVRIVRTRFLPVPDRFTAMVVWPDTILVRTGATLTERLLAHELAHVEQIRRLGLARYWLTYLWRLLRGGYAAHDMEHEARRAETNARYRAWARALLDGSQP